jgi:hypothetical protein
MTPEQALGAAQTDYEKDISTSIKNKTTHTSSYFHNQSMGLSCFFC